MEEAVENVQNIPKDSPDIHKNVSVFPDSVQDIGSTSNTFKDIGGNDNTLNTNDGFTNEKETNPITNDEQTDKSDPEVTAIQTLQEKKQDTNICAINETNQDNEVQMTVHKVELSVDEVKLNEIQPEVVQPISLQTEIDSNEPDLSETLNKPDTAREADAECEDDLLPQSKRFKSDVSEITDAQETTIEEKDKETTEDNLPTNPVIESVFQFDGPPRQLTGAWQSYRTKDNTNYLRGCKWAPDGTCILTNSNDNTLRLYNLPDQLYKQGGENRIIPEMEPVLKMKEADTIYDYCWYPTMSSADPVTACLAVTSRDTPVHMYDAFTGDIRCSYRAFDQMDEITAAHSVSFNPTGDKLYCGFNKMIRVFDVSRPGRDCHNRPTCGKEGQRGILSCICHSPTDQHMYAVGSYSRTIAVYNDPGEMVCMFEGQQGGVTQLMFSPDGSKLYSGGRKDNEILCWDLRQPGHILYTMIRSVCTNQRIYFDMTSDGRYLVSGSHHGNVLVWDTWQPSVVYNNMEPVLQAHMSYQAHTDTVNGVSLHPSLPIVATSSGQRHFLSYQDSDSDEGGGEGEPRGGDSKKQADIDNSLRLWWIPPSTENTSV